MTTLPRPRAASSSLLASTTVINRCTGIVVPSPAAICYGVATLSAALKHLKRPMTACPIKSIPLGTLLGLAILLFVGCSSTDVAKPDVVVGIELRCSEIRPGADVAIELRGQGVCGTPEGVDPSEEAFIWDDGNGNHVFNRRLELTIRTPQGTAYTLTVPPGTNVHVRDTWPQ